MKPMSVVTFKVLHSVQTAPTIFNSPLYYREVQIVRLISKDTVEEAMLKCSLDKLKLERDVISTNVQEDGKSSTKDVASILKQALAVQHGKS